MGRAAGGSRSKRSAVKQAAAGGRKSRETAERQDGRETEQ